MNAKKQKIGGFVGWVLTYLINGINDFFDGSLPEFKETYTKVVDEVLPIRPKRKEVVLFFLNFKELYYKHKADRRYIFYTYLIVVPSLFVGMFWLREVDNWALYYFLDALTILFTIVTIFFFSIYRRKILKKAMQIMAFQKKYPYLPKDFVVTSKLHYSRGKGLSNQYLSTTNLYRVVVIAVLMALIALLFI